MPNIDLLTPNWNLTISSGGTVQQTTVEDGDPSRADGMVGEGAQISVAGTVTQTSYLYLLQIAEDNTVAVLYPAAGSVHVDTGAAVRLPSTGTFTTPLLGIVRVVEASAPVSPDQWPALLQGRDNKPNPTTIGGSVPI
jgi:hypothetical protein